MADALDRLLHRLELRPGERTASSLTWIGDAGANALNLNNRLFGGMVAAQAVVAAGRSHPDRTIHSVQQVFLRPGRADVELNYVVTTGFEGGTYTGTRVDVVQGGDLISHALVGLTRGIDSPARQDPAPATSPTETLVNRDEYRHRPNWEDQPVELRVDPAVEDSAAPDYQLLLRPAGTLPADPLIHQAVLAYATDRGFMNVSWRPVRDTGEYRGSTLDHSIWFHRPVQLVDWHSHTAHSPSLHMGRGLVQGQVHDAGGTLVATTTQQGTFRPV